MPLDRSPIATVRASLFFGCVGILAGCAGEPHGQGEPVAESVETVTSALLSANATASSVQSASYPASAAVDGNLNTRWSSQFSDPQWIDLDFGSVQAIHRVTLHWENAYATAYQLQVSNDGSAWTSIETVTNGAGGTTDFTGLSASGRYLRMYGTKRATQYGYSLWEIEVNAGSTGSDAGLDAGSDAGVDASTDGLADASDAGVDASADASADAEAGGATATACKRGLAYGYDSLADLTALANGGKGISWWYNWSLTPDQGVGNGYAKIGVDFVPMQWGGNFSVNSDVSTIPSGAHYLLAFNEPESASQANLTPQQAAALWPQLEQIAKSHNPPLALVSPAVNYCGGTCNETSPFTWLDQFFAACTNCQVDAIAVHWYSCYLSAIQGYVGQMKKYNKPIWLTEFAGLDSPCTTTAAAEQTYMAAALPYLESEPAVARYSWFTGRSTSSPGINLLNGSGQLTPLGSQYVNAPQACKGP
jgi:hypothetical protein